MDLKKIHELLRLMDESKLEEIELDDGKFKVRLKKEPKEPASPREPRLAPAGGELAPGAGPAPGGRPPSPEGEHDRYYTITSPIVGTFYRAPTPDGEPFVEVGDPVEADAVVCIVEAMKVMNEVRAETAGTVEKILIENGTPVDYGQPLFLIARP